MNISSLLSCLLQVLMDVGDDVSDVIISADGSWKAIMETGENEGQKPNYWNEKPSQRGSATASTGVPRVMVRCFSRVVSDARMVSGTSEIGNANTMPSSGVTVASPLNLDYGICGSANPISGLQNQSYNNSQLQQLQSSSATGNKEFGGSLSMHSLESRTPAARTRDIKIVSLFRILVNKQRPTPGSRQLPTQMNRQLPSRPVQIQTPTPESSRQMYGNLITSHQVAKEQSGSIANTATNERNWRPSGRMRGSLAGISDVDALGVCIIPPTPTRVSQRQMVERVPPPQPQPPAATLGVAQNRITPSYANTFRVTAVCDRLLLHLQPGAENNPTEFFNLCLSLARGIDFAVANNEILPQANEIPALLRHVCQRKNDLLLQAAIMVLMISVKHACKMGMFKENETQDLYALANEMGNNFCGEEDITEVTSLSIIPTVMSRFYPQMKMGQILASVEVKDTGPQMPTDVTLMLKYGTNLLQAVGQFNGHCIIAVAFMSVTPVTDDPVLDDYVQSSGGADTDSELIEGPSRISLNCPISFTRIKIPVKGHSCKHHQVLKDVGYDVSDVIISADGSWKAVLEENEGQQCNYPNEKPDQQEAAASAGVPMMMDLTGDDGMDTVDSSEIEDRKPLQSTLHLPPTNNLNMMNNVNAIDPSLVTRVTDGFWSNVLCHGSVVSSTGIDAQMVSGISGPANANVMASSGVAIHPALNLNGIHGNANPTSGMQNPFYGNLQLQQLQFSNATRSNEFGRSVPSHSPVSRPPAGQTMLARPQVPVLQERSRSHLNPGTTHGLPVTSPAPPLSGMGTFSHNMDWQQQYPRSRNIVSSTMQHQSTSQNQSCQDSFFTQNPFFQSQAVNLQIRNQQAGAYRATSGIPGESLNLHQHQNIQMPPPARRSPSVIRSSSPLPQALIQQGSSQVGVASMGRATGNQYARLLPSAQHPTQMSRQLPSTPVQIQTPRPGSSHPINHNGTRTAVMEQRGNPGSIANSVTDGQVDLPSEQNWRPSGRMRGSLTGQAYASALGEFMIRPTQSAAQSPRATSNLTVPPSTAPSGWQEFLANRRNAHVSQAQSTPTTDPASTSGITDARP
ncbi:hypothetical protein Tsubulata_008320 [Turnera subulata]|uniref:SP-RING-type domain-containing protein n=1 Tax=Turnera subulata TaxID=218843 RepID=A0A9Q0FYN8_9ROSI|nr:hypothetical protein Tsubulata_008320 [Turnera subulata]